MVELNEFVIHTTQYVDFIRITDQVEEIVGRSQVKNGMVLIMTAHTTTGIAVNEALECLQSDMERVLARLIPEEDAYAHSRMLHSYGTTAGNPTGHLKAHLTGGYAMFPVQNGGMVRGGAQEIFLCEFDGAQSRKIYVQLMGEA